jgi:hypothetical protein
MYIPFPLPIGDPQGIAKASGRISQALTEFDVGTRLTIEFLSDQNFIGLDAVCSAMGARLVLEYPSITPCTLQNEEPT